MAELSRTVFVATETNKDGCVLRSLPLLSGGRDILHILPYRVGATYEYLKGVFIFPKWAFFRDHGNNLTILSALHAGKVFIIGGGRIKKAYLSWCAISRVRPDLIGSSYASCTDSTCHSHLGIAHFRFWFNGRDVNITGYF